MQAGLTACRGCAQGGLKRKTNLILRREASLNSAISAGLRKAGDALKKAEFKRIKTGKLTREEQGDSEKHRRAEEYAREKEFKRDRAQHLKYLSANSDHVAEQGEPSSEGRFNATGPVRRTIGYQDDFKGRRRIQDQLVTDGMLAEPPKSIPYTEASSEFLYGTFAVLAALKAGRRQIHKLYMWCGEDGKLVDDDSAITDIVREAKRRGVPIIRVAGYWDKMLDRMSDRRPHNGLVLDAGPIPKIQVVELSSVGKPGSGITAKLNRMSKEEIQAVKLRDGAEDISLPHDAGKLGTRARYPLLLWLDRVTDTGNMGAILRSAYYFGVDAVLVPSHGTAPFSAVTIKASAGAAEYVPVLSIQNELDFMKKCQQNGWKFLAAAAEPPITESAWSQHNRKKRLTAAPQFDRFLDQTPCVLMLGNEGEGLRPWLVKQADHKISIPGAPQASDIDSLNVSVAAALLTHRLLGNHLEA